MKYLIVGRSGTGKDTLANLLAERGLKVLKSYTTRAPRYEGEDTHIFINKDKADSYTDKIATTTINGVEYFATRKQLDECDIYIIDPNGIYELIENCPDISFHVIHMLTDKDIAKERAANRGADYDLEAKIFESRYASEDAQFSEFEAKMAEKKPLAENCCAFSTFTNNGDKEQIYNFSAYLYGSLQEFRNIRYITEQCINLGVLNQSEIGCVDVAQYDENNNIITVNKPIDLFVDTVLADEEGFNRIMHAYLSSTPIYYEP